MDFGPYLQRVLHDVKINWYNLIPESARPPNPKKGNVSIEFAISKDGRVKGMEMEQGGSSGEAALDRAAWFSITASDPFPPLPSEFGGQYLALRLHFFYNPDRADLEANPTCQPSTTGFDINRVDKPPLGGLGAKCAPYTNTKIEDLESKRVALPPHECTAVLAWMRDSRVEKLYASEKRPQ